MRSYTKRRIHPLARRLRRIWPVLFFSTAALLPARPALAGCCRVVKVDSTVETTVVQVCQPDAAGDCGELRFAGELATGEGESVCVDGPTLVYREWDALEGAFGPPVGAVCEGADVEI